MVVALAAGNPDTLALFTNLTNAQLTAISTNYTAKSALVTASLEAALPSGKKAEDYFTGVITEGQGIDAVFDTYKITINPTDGITIKTKDASATNALTIPTITVTGNTNQALPAIIVPGTPTALSVAGTYLVTNSDGGSILTLVVTTNGAISGSDTDGGEVSGTANTQTGAFTVTIAGNGENSSNVVHITGTINLLTGAVSGTFSFTDPGYPTTTGTISGSRSSISTTPTTNFTAAVGSYTVASPNKGIFNVDSSGNVTITESGTVIGNGKLTATSTSTLFNFTASFTTDTDTLQGTLNTVTHQFSGTKNGSGSWSATKI